MDSKKSRLNLPAGMEISLRLETPAPVPYAPAPSTPSPSKTTYSDRFIPCRSSSRLQNFALVEKPTPKEGGNEAYTRLLRAELFGPDAVPCSPSGQVASPMSPNKNIFRFKTDHSAPSSPFAATGNDGGVFAEVSTPPKVPRKIPKTPHKVLDAPSLQDDFYLNLVDWSSQNMLAVGLGTCVYLWSASTSKVTKLCDLGSRSSACGIQWTREGSYLAIGTSLGDVQVCPVRHSEIDDRRGNPRYMASWEISHNLSVIVDSPLSRRAHLDRLLEAADRGGGARVVIVECRPADEAEWLRQLEERGTAAALGGDGDGGWHKPATWGRAGTGGGLQRVLRLRRRRRAEAGPRHHGADGGGGRACGRGGRVPKCEFRCRRWGTERSGRDPVIFYRLGSEKWTWKQAGDCIHHR